MKTKEILLITTLALMLQGCGANEDDTEISAALFYQDIKPEDRRKKTEEIQKHVREYVFANYTDGMVLKGILSRPAKNLIKKIWSRLENIGFSGYDPQTLDDKIVNFSYEWHTPKPGSPASDFFKHPSITSLSFHGKFILSLVHWCPELGAESFRNPQNLRLTFALEGLSANGNIMGKYNSDQWYVSESKEWYDKGNKIIIDALKEDPFFKQFFKAPAAPADASGGTSALAALKGTTGVNATQFTMNGISGSQVDLGLPMYVQLKGALDQGKSTDGVTGLIAYKLGNSVVGVIQSYAKSGTGFSYDSRHTESSIVAAHSFGVAFVEAQFGSVSATDVNSKDWSGVRSQVKLGIDTPFGAPFVQLTHRDFGSTSDTAAYIGFEIANAEFKADTYAFSTTLLTKAGHHSTHGATGSIDWTATLILNSGITFNTNLSLGSAAESKAALNVSLDR